MQAVVEVETSSEEFGGGAGWGAGRRGGAGRRAQRACDGFALKSPEDAIFVARVAISVATCRMFVFVDTFRWENSRPNTGHDRGTRVGCIATL